MKMEDIEKLRIMVDEFYESMGETLEDYAFGYCHNFAVALAEVFDYKIEAIWITDRWEVGRGLVHAYATDGKEKYDAHGISSEEIIEFYKFREDLSNGAEFFLRKYETIEEFQKDIALQYNGGLKELLEEKNSIKVAKEFIVKNKEMFCKQEKEKLFI